MRILTKDATLTCAHEMGIVGIAATQSLVTVNDREVLVESDPEHRPITGCPNVGPGIKACTSTLAVKTGYSDLLRVQGRRVCLDTVTGFTDGTPPGVVKYDVRKPGQDFVSEV